MTLDRNTIIILVAAVVVLLVGYALWQEPAQEMREGEVVAQEVNYHDGVMGYLAAPEAAFAQGYGAQGGSGPYPALVLVHEWWGLTDDVRNMAERFAEEGYVALAVDLYNGESTDSPARARELTSMVRENTDAAFANLESALSYLKEQSYVDGESLASVGWCFGGGWAYNMAANDLDIDASVMYYGQFDPQDDFEHMRASILGHFGEEDTGISVDNVREFQAALETANGMHEVYIYPNVGHGFANYRGGDNLAYSEEAAELAWERTLNFLQDAFENY